MDRQAMAQRTKTFALRVMKLTRALPTGVQGRVIADQLLRCSMSVAANYRASGRARSKAEFVAKLGIVEEEADEACFWLEIIMEAEMIPPSRVQPLHTEANEILSIIVASRKSARTP